MCLSKSIGRDCVRPLSYVTSAIREAESRRRLTSKCAPTVLSQIQRVEKRLLAAQTENHRFSCVRQMNTTCLQATEQPYKAAWPGPVHSYAVKEVKMEEFPVPLTGISQDSSVHCAAKNNSFKCVNKQPHFDQQLTVEITI